MLNDRNNKKWKKYDGIKRLNINTFLNIHLYCMTTSLRLMYRTGVKIPASPFMGDHSVLLHLHLSSTSSSLWPFNLSSRSTSMSTLRYSSGRAHPISSLSSPPEQLTCAVCPMRQSFTCSSLQKRTSNIYKYGARMPPETWSHFLMFICRWGESCC